MNRSFSILSGVTVMAFASIACSNGHQDSPAAPEPSKTEQLKQDIKKEADEVAKKAEETAKKLEIQVKKEVDEHKNTPAPATASSAPASASTAVVADSTTVAATPPPPPEKPLKTQFTEKKSQSLRTLELDLAKEKAINRVSYVLSNETNHLYEAATTQLSSALGKLSTPEVQESYFFDNEDLDRGQFEVALVRESYVKSEKGDVCLINTKVSVHTTVDSELTPPTAISDSVVPSAETESAEQVATLPPDKYTEIKCFNGIKPTLYQQIVR